MNLPAPPRAFTVIDGLLVLVLLASGAAYVPLSAAGTPGVAVVYRDNKIVAEYPLSAQTTARIDGVTGGVTLMIRDGRVSVVSATCPRQICRHGTPIRRPFEQIVCVPNHLLVEIRSGGNRRFDAVAR